MNPTAFHDDFWSRFIPILVCTISTTVMLTVNIITGCQTMGYFICNGKVVHDVEKLLSEVMASIVIASLVLHLIINFKIRLFKNGATSATAGSGQHKLLYLKEIQVNALVNYTLNIITILVLLGSVVCIVRLDNMPKMGDLISFPNYYCAYYINLYAPCLATDILIFSFYAKSGIKKSLKEELMNALS